MRMRHCGSGDCFSWLLVWYRRYESIWASKLSVFYKFVTATSTISKHLNIQTWCFCTFATANIHIVFRCFHEINFTPLVVMILRNCCYENISIANEITLRHNEMIGFVCWVIIFFIYVMLVRTNSIIRHPVTISMIISWHYLVFSSHNIVMRTYALVG